MKSVRFTISLLFVFLSATLSAQEDDAKGPVNVGADLVTSYIWRGMELGSGPAVQPWGEVTAGSFAFGSWGSYEFTGDFKEIDIYAKYTFNNFTATFTDLFFPGYPGLDQDYFNFNSKTTGHCSEFGLSFNGTEKFPFSIYGGFIVYGVAVDPDPEDDTRVNHSAYLEVKYMATRDDYTFNIFAGVAAGESSFYQTNGFSICNVGATAQKAVKITDSFTVPMKLGLTLNPELEKAFLTYTISF